MEQNREFKLFNKIHFCWDNNQTSALIVLMATIGDVFEIVQVKYSLQELCRQYLRHLF